MVEVSMQFTDLSDDELLSGLKASCIHERQLLARIVAYLGEVEERRLHLKAACPSLFDFCVRRLGMSEGEAFRRIAVARLVRRFPGLFPRIEGGEIHLSALLLLRDHLTDSNYDELVSAAKGKSKREVQELVAKIASIGELGCPQDVPSTIRKLPTPIATTTAVASSGPAMTLALGNEPSRAVAPQLEPLSEARYKLQLTASAELRQKLERAADLMRHRNPTGDLAVVVERALDELIVRLEKERLGKTTRPQKTARPAKQGHVTQAVRREVFARDGEQCTFVDEAGQRCPSRSFLELDHAHPRALGGSGEASNISVLCRGHNLMRAEQAFGRESVEHGIHMRQRKSQRVNASRPAAETKSAAPEGNGEGVVAAFELVARGLMRMGFREGDARRAMRAVRERGDRDASTLPVESLLREALAVLT